MKTVTIARIGDHKTVAYAADELIKYLKAADTTAMIEHTVYDDYDETVKNVLWLGTSDKFNSFLPAVDDAELDDAAYISVKDYSGIITGTNNRSVLISVYRFLKELGFAFIRPGDDGDIVPALTVDKCNVEVNEVPSYRHRSICIEGAVGYTHVYNIINWMPKAGLNGYFIQFSVPFTFFDRWYSAAGNRENFTREDTEKIQTKIIEDLSLRSMMNHAVGHGWTCDPLGIRAGGWGAVDDSKISDEVRPMLAELGGKRTFYGGRPMDTQLCLSNAKVQDIVLNAIVDYCEKHSDVTHLHFWLADGYNNHCECENCKAKIPADWYVDWLNELDRRLTEKNLNSRIVCLVYLDLLWAPQVSKVVNQDRFVLMFAPITRNFCDSFKTVDLTEEIEIEPYVRNKCALQGSSGKLIKMFGSWQKIMPKCDSFDYDYHLWTAHLRDMGYVGIAKTLFDDMTNLSNIGLNGMVSCQLQRAAFPHNLPMQAMAAALWNKNADFNTVKQEYFTAAYGEKYGSAAMNYLSNITALCEPGYEIGNQNAYNLPAEKRAQGFSKALELIESFKPTIEKALGEELPFAQNKSWQYLKYHSEYAALYCTLQYNFRIGNNVEADEKAVLSWLDQNEAEVHTVLDCWRARSIIDSKYYQK